MESLLAGLFRVLITFCCFAFGFLLAFLSFANLLQAYAEVGVIEGIRVSNEEIRVSLSRKRTQSSCTNGPQITKTTLEMSYLKYILHKDISHITHKVEDFRKGYESFSNGNYESIP